MRTNNTACNQRYKIFLHFICLKDNAIKEKSDAGKYNLQFYTQLNKSAVSKTVILIIPDNNVIKYCYIKQITCIDQFCSQFSISL